MRAASLLLAIMCFGAQAQVTKCTDPKTGAVSYTNGPCQAGQGAKAVAITDNSAAATPTEILRREDTPVQPGGAVSMGSAPVQPSQPVASKTKGKKMPPRLAIDPVASCSDYNGVLTCASDTDSYMGRAGSTSFMRASDGKICTSVMAPKGSAMSCP